MSKLILNHQQFGTNVYLNLVELSIFICMRVNQYGLSIIVKIYLTSILPGFGIPGGGDSTKMQVRGWGAHV